MTILLWAEYSRNHSTKLIDVGMNETTRLATSTLGQLELKASLSNSSKEWCTEAREYLQGRGYKALHIPEKGEGEKHMRRQRFRMKLEATAKEGRYWGSQKRDTVLASLRGLRNSGSEKGSKPTINERLATLHSAELIRHAIEADYSSWKVSWPLKDVGNSKEGGDDWLGRIVKKVHFEEPISTVRSNFGDEHF